MLLRTFGYFLGIMTSTAIIRASHHNYKIIYLKNKELEDLDYLSNMVFHFVDACAVYCFDQADETIQHLQHRLAHYRDTIRSFDLMHSAPISS